MMNKLHYSIELEQYHIILQNIFTDFVKEFLLLLATQQHLINTSANESVSTPNSKTTKMK